MTEAKALDVFYEAIKESPYVGEFCIRKYLVQARLVLGIPQDAEEIWETNKQSSLALDIKRLRKKVTLNK